MPVCGVHGFFEMLNSVDDGDDYDDAQMIDHFLFDAFITTIITVNF